jgi:hypothetical protein
MSAAGTSPISRRERLRRVVLLCCNVARNIAFYQAGWTGKAQPRVPDHHPDVGFWRQVNGNFLDMAVPDWCKLFGDQRNIPLKRVGKHHWRRVVTDPVAFEAELLTATRLDSDGMAALITKVRCYRDTFVAHLDDGLVMHIPELDDAFQAVRHYHRHIVEREARSGDLNGLPSAQQFSLGYRQCIEEAARVYAVPTTGAA